MASSLQAHPLTRAQPSNSAPAAHRVVDAYVLRLASSSLLERERGQYREGAHGRRGRLPIKPHGAPRVSPSTRATTISFLPSIRSPVARFKEQGRVQVQRAESPIVVASSIAFDGTLIVVCRVWLLARGLLAPFPVLGGGARLLISVPDVVFVVDRSCSRVFFLAVVALSASPHHTSMSPRSLSHSPST